MVYAILFAVLIISAALILFRGEVKPTYFERYDDSRYYKELDAFISKLPSPNKKGKDRYAIYAYEIRRAILYLSLKQNREIYKEFAPFKADIRAMLKGVSVAGLPSIDDKPRAVLIAEFALAHSGYEFSSDRITAILNAQNRHSTLTFAEIEGMKDAFKYALVEKLSYIFAELVTLARAMRLARGYVYAPASIGKRGRALLKSNLFLSFCAEEVGYESDSLRALSRGVIDRLKGEAESVIRSYAQVCAFDFSRFYTPLELLDKYSAFSSASAEEKKAFLALLSKLSDKENLDEFIYAVRLDKYMTTASAGHMNVRRTKTPFGYFALVGQKADISALASALSSGTMMKLIFGRSSKKFRKIIAKIDNFENSYEPIYKFKTVNFGISTIGGILRLVPKLPSEIDEANLKLNYNGIIHSIRILRGDRRAVYLGDTELVGITELRLGDRPLDITMIIPHN